MDSITIETSCPWFIDRESRVQMIERAKDTKRYFWEESSVKSSKVDYIFWKKCSSLLFWTCFQVNHWIGHRIQDMTTAADAVIGGEDILFQIGWQNISKNKKNKNRQEINEVSLLPRILFCPSIVLVTNEWNNWTLTLDIRHRTFSEFERTFVPFLFSGAEDHRNYIFGLKFCSFFPLFFR